MPFRSTMKILFFLGFFLLSSRALAKDQVLIEVELDPTKDHWQITYTLDRPTPVLFFKRQINLFRAKRWIPNDRNFIIEKVNGLEKIQRTDGKPFSKFALKVPLFYENFSGDYNLFQRFSDGGILLYTGHFNVIRDQNMSEDEIKTTFRFIPPPKMNIIVQGGRTLEKTIEWNNQSRDGTFVYFGEAEPIKTPNMTMILDRSFPKWLDQKIREIIPKLFTFYRDKTGFELDFTPLIFISFEDGDPRLTDNKGGTLPNNIQLAFKGGGWKKENRQALEEGFEFLAHEAAHLWNGEMFHMSGKSEESWIHEGGADAFAFRAMRDLGVITRDEYEVRLNDNIARCALRLESSLAKTKTSKGNNVHYNCGSTLATISEGFLRQSNEKTDLFTLWRRIFELAENNNRRYASADYYAALYSITKNPAHVAALKNLIDHTHDDVGYELVSSLKKGGYKVEKTRKSNRVLVKEVLGMLMTILMKQDCDGMISFSTYPEYVTLYGDKRCRNIKTEVKVTRIGSHKIVESGETAYDEARHQCQTNNRVTLGLENGEVIQLNCPSLGKRPIIDWVLF